MDAGKAVDIFYLDFSKAFDTVSHSRLLIKLEAKGIGGPVLEWIRDWLTDRTQVVKIGQARSTQSAVTSGVPQGSVLGPTLFTVYIDDIDEVAGDLDLMVKFADDTKGMKVIENEEDRAKLQNTLDRLYNWAEKWGMKFNLDKCKIMHVGKNNPKHEYKMGGQKLAVVTEEKDIGVTITSNLKPTKHCQKAAGMEGAVLTQITRNFHFRDRHVFKRLYVQYVRPHVEFASPCWSPWTAADKLLIERVQMRAVGMISGLRSRDYADRCAELGLETLEERRMKQDLIQAYKIMRKVDRVKPDLLFNKVEAGPGRVTRGRSDPENVIAKRSSLEVRKHSYSVRVVEKWNGLDHGTKMARSVSGFKAAIKK